MLQKTFNFPFFDKVFIYKIILFIRPYYMKGLHSIIRRIIGFFKDYLYFKMVKKICLKWVRSSLKYMNCKESVNFISKSF